MSTNIDRLTQIIATSERFLKNSQARAAANVVQGQKLFRRTFSAAESEEMVGRARAELIEAESAIGIEPQQEGSKKVVYTLEQINAFRSYFGMNRWRNAVTDAPITVACQNFKGGVGKSTVCVNLAQYLALRGYRVLVVDTDSQATATAMFGFVPDVDILAEQTILPYLLRARDDLKYAVRNTYFPGIDLIPACMALYGADMSIVIDMSQQVTMEQRMAFLSLGDGVSSVANDYDIILIDSPPGPGLISVNVLLAADAIVIPTAPRMADFSSTVQFFRVIRDYLRRLSPGKEFLWMKVLRTLVDGRYESHRQLHRVMQGCLEDWLFECAFPQSSAIINAAAVLQTPYEQPNSDRKVLKMLDAVFGEIERAIVKGWPSKNVPAGNCKTTAAP